MFPFRTNVHAHGSPVVTMSLIVLNIAVFFIQIGLPPASAERFIYTYALVPAVYGNPGLARQVGLDPTNLLPFVSNTFMHGGFLHLIVNMWTLWLFGVPTEDRLGPWRFLLFYLICGLAGSIGHLVFNLDSVVPALGASGAIAGLLGAFSMLYPRAKVLLVVPIIVVPLFFQVPALLYTAVWFGLQVYQGTASLGAGAVGGGIAWWAHIGGFVCGLYLARRMKPPIRRGPWST